MACNPLSADLDHILRRTRRSGRSWRPVVCFDGERLLLLCIGKFRLGNQGGIGLAPNVGIDTNPRLPISLNYEGLVEIA